MVMGRGSCTVKIGTSPGRFAGFATFFLTLSLWACWMVLCKFIFAGLTLAHKIMRCLREGVEKRFLKGLNSVVWLLGGKLVITLLSIDGQGRSGTVMDHYRPWALALSYSF